LTWNLGLVSPGSYTLTITGLISEAGDLTDGDILANVAQLSDATGGTQIIQVGATVSTTDIPPVASFFVVESPDQLGQVTEFRSTSTGTNLSHRWDFGDNTALVNSLTPTMTHTYPAIGTYTATLTVSNGSGSDTATAQVKIIDPSAVEPPLASFTSSSPDKLGQTTTFINTSQDGGADPAHITYLWNFGDGTTSHVKNPVHIYPKVGTYPVQLTIINANLSLSHTTTGSVIIEESLAPFPQPAPKKVFLPVVVKQQG
jgi:PKD repeat protein